jgi:hypothetical protein
MTPAQREAWELYQQLGSYSAVAKALGKHRKTVTHQIEKAQRYVDADQGIKDAMVGTKLNDIGNIHSGWLKTEEASIYFRMPEGDPTQTLIDDIREAFSDIPRCPPLPMPDASREGLLTVYPVFDAHIGMKAWGDETGEDYDTNKAYDRITNGIGSLVSSAPSSERAVVIVGGDLLHANDQTNATPQSKHILDVDTRHVKTVDMAIKTLAASIELIAQKHDEVDVALIPGNHDRDGYIGVMFALGERYSDCDRINVQREAGEFFVTEHGKVMIAAHHGDKAKAERLVMHMADEWPDMWGRTRFRHYFTGHLHHAKLQDIGGVQVEQLRAVAPRDAYAASHGYSARSDMQAITYCRERGEISRVRVAL